MRQIILPGGQEDVPLLVILIQQQCPRVESTWDGVVRWWVEYRYIIKKSRSARNDRLVCERYEREEDESVTEHLVSNGLETYSVLCQAYLLSLCFYFLQKRGLLEAKRLR